MRIFSNAYRQAAVLSLCLLLSAGAAQAGVIPDGANDGDYQALAAQPQYDAVGFAMRDNFQGVPILDSSAILVAPDWVLTAAHTEVTKQGAGANSTFTIGGETRNVVQTFQNPSFNGQIDSGFDVGLLKLDAPITNVTPAQLYSGTAASLLGQTLTYVGYGKSGTGSTGATIASGTKRAGNNVGDELGGPTLAPFLGGNQGFSSQILFADFDSSGGPWGHPLGANQPINLEYLIALGDSGGGLFIEQGGQHFLAGVHSIIFDLDPNGTIGYGDIMGSTTLEQSLAWVLDTIAPDPIIGDLDGDGFVGIEDLNLILGNWNQNVAAGDLLLGDPSGDGFVGIEDLNVVLGNWNAGTPPPPAQAFALVPEPGTLATLALVTAAATLRRRRH